MRRKFCEAGDSQSLSAKPPIAEKITRGKQKEKNLEQKLRSFNYQKQILENEKFLELEVFHRGSEQCEEVMKNLKEEKGVTKELEILGKNEYLENLI